MWRFLSEQHLLRQTVSSQQPTNSRPYKELLEQVSSEQYAILVDLGNSPRNCQIFTTHKHAEPPPHPGIYPHSPGLANALHFVFLSALKEFRNHDSCVRFLIQSYSSLWLEIHQLVFLAVSYTSSKRRMVMNFESKPKDLRYKQPK